MIDGLPPLPPGALPTGSAQDREAYRAALGFEQVLLGELVEAMVPKSLVEGPYAGPVQDAFAGGLVAAGGVGLAAQLYPTLRKEGS
ncbi:MAG: hypothetical protein ACRDPC_14465 [Solirubrobacteraceae bacterium]